MTQRSSVEIREACVRLLGGVARNAELRANPGRVGV